MTPNQFGPADEISEEEIRQTRMATLLGAYELMRSFKEVADNTTFSDARAVLAIEDYLTERKVLIARDKIPGRIQRHKVAGLMAASIVRNHLLQDFYPDDATGLSSFNNSSDNEKFAIYHGIAICAEGCPADRFKDLLNNPYFKVWVDDFIVLLRSGSPCRPSLIHVFETLCLAFFPENLGHSNHVG